MKIVVLEPGAWGTSLGIILSRPRRKACGFLRGKKNEVSFWYENKELASKLSENRENERLPGIKIPKKIFISSSLKKIIKNTDLVINASPSFNFRKTLLKIKNLKNLPPLLGIAKGIEKETLKLPSQIVEEIFGKIPYAHLSGPGFAKEIVRGKSAKEVIASKNKPLLKKLKKLFAVEPLEVSTTTDLIGVELAGALKNALSIGISLVEAGVRNPGVEKIKKDLIQYRNKSKDLLRGEMSRRLIELGLEEVVKIGKAMGAKKETFFGPAGLGDLILTSTNPLSRNFQFGQNLLLNANKMRKEILERKITVEGFDNVFALHKLGQIYKLDLPMINEIYKAIYQKVSPRKIVQNLIKLTEKA